MDRLPMGENERVNDSAVAEVRERMLEEGEVLDLADLFKLFGDPTRLEILYAQVPARRAECFLFACGRACSLDHRYRA